MAKLTMRMVRASLRNVGITIRNNTEWGEYVVRIKGSPEGEGYHTSDMADAYQTGHAMAQERDQKARNADALTALDKAIERAKREEEAMLGLPRGSIKA